MLELSIIYFWKIENGLIMKVIRVILAVIVGIGIGSAVNMGLISISPSVISPPEGVDVSDVESIKANMHLYEFRHFIMPFLAHALGAFVGALLAGFIAPTPKSKMIIPLVIGGFFLIGGISMILMVPSPLWFTIVDLGLAYIPMAMIAGRLTGGCLKK